VARQPLILKDDRETDTLFEEMRKHFNLRRHLVGRSVKPTRQADHDQPEPVLLGAQLGEHLDEFVQGRDTEPTHSQCLERARQHHRRVADRNADSPQTHIEPRYTHAVLYYPPTGMFLAQDRRSGVFARPGHGRRSGVLGLIACAMLAGLAAMQPLHAQQSPAPDQQQPPAPDQLLPGPAPSAADRAAVLETEAERLARQARTILGELRQLEIDRQAHEERARQSAAAVAAASRALELATARLSAVEANRTTRLPEVNARLVDLYKRGRGGNLRLILGTASIREFAWSTRAVASIATTSRAKLEDYARLVVAARDERTAAASALDRLKAERRSVEEARVAATRAVQARARLLAEVDTRRDLTAQLAGELQLAARQLDERVSSIATTPAPPSPTAPVFPPRLPVRGGLEWPLSGRVAGRFGEASLRAPDAPRNGIEIEVAEGSSAKVIHDGSVVFAAPLSGFGTLVIVDHSRNYHSVYGYLASTTLRKGDVVDVGREVGLVGTPPGGGPPALYFEFRIDGRPVDPLQWLQPR
jgi:septal ring factor EnvC (AmiA/AmiB activator)